MPAHLFTGRYPDMAPKVFKYQPVDYLSKPVEESLLDAAFDRFYDIYLTQRKESKLLSLLEQVNPVRKLSFNTRSGYVFLDPSEILYIRADWNTSEVFLTPVQSEIISSGIGKVAEQLPDSIFLKVSRSLIINKTFITKVSRKDHKLWLKRNGEEVVLEVSEKVVRGIEGRVLG